ncbi:ABC transporter ATP-binding protein [Devosia yakushimensis]|uniref:ABC transporter ATP-binding protein n=1 Tax=Devosia yakushimensis TaxID=470028 RepID=A0ABQ5U8P9_9HYPH|nr:sn-glycerol-3-phosphate ABC transporter ATP-binding protein UgpC [Devosia yakushimensis]GLQ08176.1 ABC transporter ATP-binding protein [Devosia yakushimensis]
MASLSFHGVCKQFGETSVLSDVNVEIADGEFAVLVGPSGCGKSTLLRMVAGLETVTSGDVLIGGKRVNGLRPKDRDIAMVFQNYALYPHMSVEQNMSFGLRMLGHDRAATRRRVADAAAILELEPLLKRLPRDLSGGQRQRVAMGRAIVREPEIFLFDEPLSNLDAQLRTQMRIEIKSLQRRLGTTSVYVTHDQVEAMTMADRIVVMRKGRVEQVGTPMELFDRPATRFVAGFIGSPAMNFVEGRIGGMADAPVFEAWNGASLPLPDSLRSVEPGRPAVYGIRPQYLHFASVGPAGRAGVVEAFGHETYVQVDQAGQNFTVHVPGRSDLRGGETVQLALDGNKALLFDRESGIALDTGSANG